MMRRKKNEKSKYMCCFLSLVVIDFIVCFFLSLSLSLSSLSVLSVITKTICDRIVHYFLLLQLRFD